MAARKANKSKRDDIGACIAALRRLQEEKGLSARGRELLGIALSLLERARNDGSGCSDRGRLLDGVATVVKIVAWLVWLATSYKG